MDISFLQDVERERDDRLALIGEDMKKSSFSCKDIEKLICDYASPPKEIVINSVRNLYFPEESYDKKYVTTILGGMRCGVFTCDNYLVRLHNSKIVSDDDKEEDPITLNRYRIESIRICFDHCKNQDVHFEFELLELLEQFYQEKYAHLRDKYFIKDMHRNMSKLIVSEPNLRSVYMNTYHSIHIFNVKDRIYLILGKKIVSFEISHETSPPSAKNIDFFSIENTILNLNGKGNNHYRFKRIHYCEEFAYIVKGYRKQKKEDGKHYAGHWNKLVITKHYILDIFNNRLDPLTRCKIDTNDFRFYPKTSKLRFGVDSVVIYDADMDKPEVLDIFIPDVCRRYSTLTGEMMSDYSSQMDQSDDIFNLEIGLRGDVYMKVLKEFAPIGNMVTYCDFGHGWSKLVVQNHTFNYLHKNWIKNAFIAETHSERYEGRDVYAKVYTF